MTTQAASDVVRTSIMVNAPLERAFSVFTDGIDSWWPRSHTIGESPLAEMVLEGREGGRAYGRGEDGSESDWGRVLVYEPPHRVVVSWDITLQWKHELDPEKTSEFEVSFTPEGDGRTLVVLEHRHLDRHGEGWEQMRDAVGSENGWGGGLGEFAKAAEAA
jgi:uncharacterized protein YndB with AHSA1/START domain